MYDVILLDLMLPKLTGLEVCEQIRGFSNVPIIMLTAKGEDMDKILGLEYGAYDYITKPFNILEVKARIKAILRRASRQEDNPNKVYSRENLLNIVWGYKYPGDVRTIDVHIRRLREKIEENTSEPKYVHTKWGAGYYFQG